MEIAPQIHQINLGYVNAYLAVEQDGLTLIDTGMPRRQDDILAYVQKIGRAPGDVKRILITHADIDHVGSLAAVQQTTGADVYASEASAALIARGAAPKHNFLIMDLVGKFWKYKRLDKQQINILREGDILPILGGLKVLDTPGHTLDHISFFSPETKVAIIGDALATRGDKLTISPPLISADSQAAEASGRKLLELGIILFACGHGTPMKDSDPTVAALKEQLLA